MNVHACYRDCVKVPNPFTIDFEPVPREQATKAFVQERLIACMHHVRTEGVSFPSYKLLRLHAFVERFLETHRPLFPCLSACPPLAAFSSELRVKAITASRLENITVVANTGDNWAERDLVVEKIRNLAEVLPRLSHADRVALRNAVPNGEKNVAQQLPHQLLDAPTDLLAQLVHAALLFDQEFSWLDLLLKKGISAQRVGEIISCLQAEAELQTNSEDHRTPILLFLASWNIVKEGLGPSVPAPDILRSTLLLFHYTTHFDRIAPPISSSMLVKFMKECLLKTHCEEGRWQGGRYVEGRCLVSHYIIPLSSPPIWLECLESLFRLTVDGPLLDTICDVYLASQKNYLQPIQARFHQLSTLLSNESVSARFRLAYFVETKIVGVRPQAVVSQFYHKDQTRLSYSLGVDLSKRGVCLFVETQAHPIPQEVKKISVNLAYWVPFDSNQPSGVVLEERTILARECCTLHQEISAARGIAPLFARMDYPLGPLRATSVITVRPKSTLFQLFVCDVQVSDRQLVLILQDLARGLEVLHGRRFCHNAIDFDAALLHEVPHILRPQAMLYCFGAACRIGEEIAGGLYGAPPFTPPELYQRSEARAAQTDWDIWALGCLFYSLVFQHRPPWQTKLEWGLEVQNREELIQLVQKHVEHELQIYPPSDQRSIYQQLYWVILNCLRLDGYQRFTAQRVGDELQGVLDRAERSGSESFLPARMKESDRIEKVPLFS